MGRRFANDGDVDKALADAPRDKVVEADYEVPYLAHACMEPMNATARLKDGVLDVWSPNQAPTIVRQVCAKAVGVPQDKVNVHTTYMGGGFGRRAEVDFSVYAALMAKEAEGRPVKVIWTREEDIRHDAYRPAAVGRFQARLDEQGLPVALDMTDRVPITDGEHHAPHVPLAITRSVPTSRLSRVPLTSPIPSPNYRVTGDPGAGIDPGRVLEIGWQFL